MWTTVLTLWSSATHSACATALEDNVTYRNPTPTVDVVVLLAGDPARILLIRRSNPPAGWALPGGFVDEGERVESAARREALEETGLSVTLTDLLGVYSDPARDPRQHTMSVVFCATTADDAVPVAGDDAAQVIALSVERLANEVLTSSPPAIDGVPIAFDHALILEDWLALHTSGRRPALG